MGDGERHAKKSGGVSNHPGAVSDSGDRDIRHRDADLRRDMKVIQSNLVRLIVLLIVPAAGAWAQLDVHDWSNVKNIAPGSDIWIKGAHGHCSGAYLSADDNEVRLQEWRRSLFRGRYSHLCIVPRQDVREIRFAKRAISALAGTAIGVGAGVGIGLGIEAQYPNQREDGHLAAAVFGFLGGLFGEAVGEHAAFIHGDKIYVVK
jgi:hypothetical protein